MTQIEKSPRKGLDFEDVTIGILTALEEEYIACKMIFDPNESGAEKERKATSGTLNCWICKVQAISGGNHVVAITLLSHVGNTGAAIAANILLQHCPSIGSLIMCGIAGAVPHPTDQEHHVRLGDIVVSSGSGIIQYDFGKQRDPLRDPTDPFRGFEFRPPPRPPCPNLLAAVQRMHAAEKILGRGTSREWEKKVEDFLSRVENKLEWKRPPRTKDKLIDTPDGKGDETKHPKQNARRYGKPSIFRGLIGAANIVLADPKKRDALRDRWKIKAVEMEGSGVADATWVASAGYLVIRGTCDYCNSTKNDEWHQYAALIAAAYARTVVENLHAQPAKPAVKYPTEKQIPTPVPSVMQGPSATPGKLDGAVPVSDASQPPTTQRTVVTPANQEVPPSAISQASSPKNVPTPGAIGSETPITQNFLPVGQEYQRVRDLIEELNLLVQNHRSAGIEPLAQELEKQLNALPRKGPLVRDGWILLARIESGRQLTLKAAGRPVDPTRLRRLREEAENVTD